MAYSNTYYAMVKGEIRDDEEYLRTVDFNLCFAGFIYSFVCSLLFLSIVLTGSTLVYLEVWLAIELKRYS